MFCEKCGAKNDDSFAFCTACGEAMQTDTVSKSPAKPRRLLTCIIVIVLAAVIAVMASSGFLGGRSAEDTAAGIVHALKALDLVQLHELLPEPVQDALEGPDDSREEYFQLLTERNEELESELASLSSRIDWDLGPITDVSEDTLNELKTYYQDGFGIKITDAKTLTVYAEIKVLGLFGQRESTDVYLVEHKGSWYLDWESMQNLF